RGGHQPGVLAGTPGGDQHAAETEAVGSLGDLRQIAVVHGTSTFGGAQVLAITMGRQEPEDVEAHGVVSFPEIVIVRINPGNSAPPNPRLDERGIGGEGCGLTGPGPPWRAESRSRP